MISSTQAAGYGDFIKILNDRWGGVKVDVAHVQVQGEAAPDQMIRAINYFNERDTLAEVLIIIRGGGSADDLSAFNDELLVREIAASRIPMMVGVGHEIDETLADLAADVRASTPSNAAQRLVPDRQELIRATQAQIRQVIPKVEQAVVSQQVLLSETLRVAFNHIDARIGRQEESLYSLGRILAQVNPQRVLERGYALLRGKPTIGSIIEVETKQAIIKAKVERYDKK